VSKSSVASNQFCDIKLPLQRLVTYHQRPNALRTPTPRYIHRTFRGYCFFSRRFELSKRPVCIVWCVCVVRTLGTYLLLTVDVSGIKVGLSGRFGGIAVPLTEGHIAEDGYRSRTAAKTSKLAYLLTF
jgi:hypothetical protein